eukprot:CAMPEP_0170135782 /NCGR_PEP_ID=MMETSP0033_2-20121228/2667_1 /TAXON_ID=195969 /ORGANISM="Dolichomastix tenuilepis, Strain CCMP3274" /LENGTH=377 /DNA_ID=CAMNT_0010371393 /DNA_START=74 /DNA_END=1207 /DNA_ORIENTATION=-
MKIREKHVVLFRTLSSRAIQKNGRRLTVPEKEDYPIPLSAGQEIVFDLELAIVEAMTKAQGVVDTMEEDDAPLAAAAVESEAENAESSVEAGLSTRQGELMSLQVDDRWKEYGLQHALDVVNSDEIKLVVLLYDPVDGKYSSAHGHCAIPLLATVGLYNSSYMRALSIAMRALYKENKATGRFVKRSPGIGIENVMFVDFLEEKAGTAVNPGRPTFKQYTKGMQNLIALLPVMANDAVLVSCCSVVNASLSMYGISPDPAQFSSTKLYQANIDLELYKKMVEEASVGSDVSRDIDTNPHFRLREGKGWKLLSRFVPYTINQFEGKKVVFFRTLSDKAIELFGRHISIPERQDRHLPMSFGQEAMFLLTRAIVMSSCI